MLAPEAWLALLRVVIGAWFLKAVWTKLALAWGVLPYPTVSPRFVGFHPKRVAEFAAGNPIGWYKDFLEQTVLPNAALFATLQVWARWRWGSVSRSASRPGSPHSSDSISR
jgi:hypothetical protein